MIEPADQPHLAEEAGDGIGPGEVLPGDELQRNDAAHEAMAGLVDLTHGASAHQVEDHVAADD